MFGHFAASASKSARVILRQELPPKPSARPTLIGLSPQNFEMSWIWSCVPALPMVTLAQRAVDPPPPAAPSEVAEEDRPPPQADMPSAEARATVAAPSARNLP